MICQDIQQKIWESGITVNVTKNMRRQNDQKLTDVKFI